VKSELERVRDWAEARIKSGDAPDWSWEQHVKLIEAADALLHDMAVASDPVKTRKPFGGNLRLIERADSRAEARIASEMAMKRKAGRLH